MVKNELMTTAQKEQTKGGNNMTNSKNNPLSSREELKTSWGFTDAQLDDLITDFRSSITNEADFSDEDIFRDEIEALWGDYQARGLNEF